MFIKSVTVRNFRNFRNSKLLFKSGDVNTIVGENASGKTNVFYAMRLVLDDSLPINARYLQETDFYNGLGVSAGHWIIVSMTFGGLGKSDEELVMANHALELDNGEAEGSYTYVFRPRLHIRKRLFEISTEQKDRKVRLKIVNDYLQTLNIDKESYEAVAFIRTSVDFLYDEPYHHLVGDFDNGVFPNPEMEDSALIGAIKPAYFSLIREVTCTYVKALRNVVSDMNYSKSNPLYRLLAHKSKEVKGAEGIVDNVKQVNHQIAELAQIKNLSTSIAKTLISAVGQTYSPSLAISSDLPEDIESLVQSLSLIVEDSMGYKGTGKIEDLSLGGANLIFLALKLNEYEINKENEDKIAHFLLIEEPEAHIHNHIQKTLFSNFNMENTQVFVSTHSTQISSVSNISSLNIISRKTNYSEIFWPSNGILPEEIVRIERYLDAMRSTLLFAKGVILVEGDAEQILIPRLIKTILGVSLDEMGISLVKMDGTVFKHISCLFDHNRIRNYCSILTDHDQSFLDKPTAYANESYISKLGLAQESGMQRFKEQLAFCKGNVYLKPFFAKNTFETELILAGNEDLFIGTLPNLYSQKKRIDDMASFLKGDNASKCFHSLHLANKEGKGWYSILLSDFVHPMTRIPDYILAALSHVLKSHNKEVVYKSIMDYRLSLYGETYEGLQGSNFIEKQSSFRGFVGNDPIIPLLDQG